MHSSSLLVSLLALIAHAASAPTATAGVNGQRFARGLPPARPAFLPASRVRRQDNPQGSAPPTLVQTTSVQSAGTQCGYSYDVTTNSKYISQTNILVETAPQPSMQDCLNQCDEKGACLGGNYDEAAQTCYTYGAAEQGDASSPPPFDQSNAPAALFSRFYWVPNSSPCQR